MISSGLLSASDSFSLVCNCFALRRSEAVIEQLPFHLKKLSKMRIKNIVSAGKLSRLKKSLFSGVFFRTFSIKSK